MDLSGLLDTVLVSSMFALTLNIFKSPVGVYAAFAASWFTLTLVLADYSHPYPIGVWFVIGELGWMIVCALPVGVVSRLLDGHRSYFGAFMFGLVWVMMLIVPTVSLTLWLSCEFDRTTGCL